MEPLERRVVIGDSEEMNGIWFAPPSQLSKRDAVVEVVKVVTAAARQKSSFATVLQDEGCMFLE